MFKPGDPKPQGSGRKAGTPNRKTDDLFELCETKGINPFEALLEMATSEDETLKLAALKELCQYLYAKRKAIEATVVTDATSNSESLSPVDHVELLTVVRQERHGQYESLERSRAIAVESVLQRLQKDIESLHKIAPESHSAIPAATSSEKT